MSSTAEGKQAVAPALADDSSTEEGQSSADSAGAHQSEAGNVDKIREILFGGNMRDYDKRFSRLEERLAKESSDLRSETKKLFESLEAFVKKEFEALSNRLEESP